MRAPTVRGGMPSRDLPSQSLCDSSPKGRAFIYKDFNNMPLTTGEVAAVRQAERGLKESNFYFVTGRRGADPYGFA